MPLYEKPDEQHEKHLCEIIKRGATFSDYYDLVKDPKYICRQCGRAARKAENLCDPTSIP